MEGSKWTWLRDKCLDLGYVKAAELAQEIEDQLYDIYGETSTVRWRSARESVIEGEFDANPDLLIGSSVFCQACVESKKVGLRCSECEFKKKTGMCSDGESLFLRFCDMFELEERRERRGEKNE